MGTSKKLTVEELRERALKQKQEAERVLSELDGAEFWEKNADFFKTFWKTKVKDFNKDTSDLVLLNRFIKSVGMKGIEVVKKPSQQKKKLEVTNG